MPAYRWAVGAGLVLGVGVFALDRLALALIRPPRKPLRRSVDDLAHPSRVVRFTSLGQPLTGWLVEPTGETAAKEEVTADDDAAVGERTAAGVVLVHGWGSNHGAMIPLAAALLEAGHPVFLFDVRFHGVSPPAPFVTARHYRDDVLAAVRKAGELLPGRPWVIAGHSMGGSAAILAIAEGAPVAGLVTIAAPADLWAVWAFHFEERGWPGTLLVRMLRPAWRVRAGVPFSRLRPDKRVEELDLPFLLLHGEDDASVAPWHASVLAEREGVEAVLLPGRGHSDLLGSPDVHEKVLGFVESI